MKIAPILLFSNVSDLPRVCIYIVHALSELSRLHGVERKQRAFKYMRCSSILSGYTAYTVSNGPIDSNDLRRNTNASTFYKWNAISPLNTFQRYIYIYLFIYSYIYRPYNCFKLQTRFINPWSTSGFNFNPRDLVFYCHFVDIQDFRTIFKKLSIFVVVTSIIITLLCW